MKAAFIVPENDIMPHLRHEISRLDHMLEYKARKRLWSTPHLGLLTIAAMMGEDWELVYQDLNYSTGIEFDFDWVFLSPTTSQVNRAYELADKFREAGTKIAIGGYHASVLPQEAMAHADVVFIGEAEDTLKEFMEDMDRGQVKPIYASACYPNILKSPIPKYELVKDYPYKSMPIQTSRGCPHQCNFCISSKLHGKKVRRKTIEQVHNELLYLVNVKQRPLVFFTDDNIFLDTDFSLKLLKILEDLKIRWYAFSDAGIAYKEHVLEKMSRAGCMQLIIGFESLKEENLTRINRSKWKRGKLQQYRDVVTTIQQYGIGVVGSFILGMDGDRKSDFDNLYSFILDTNMYATNISILTPFPGTETYEILKSQNRIFTDNWTRFSGFELTFMPDKMQVDEFEYEFARLYEKLDSSQRIDRVYNYYIERFKSKNNNFN